MYCSPQVPPVKRPTNKHLKPGNHVAGETRNLVRTESAERLSHIFCKTASVFVRVETAAIALPRGITRDIPRGVLQPSRTSSGKHQHAAMLPRLARGRVINSTRNTTRRCRRSTVEIRNLGNLGYLPTTLAHICTSLDRGWQHKPATTAGGVFSFGPPRDMASPRPPGRWPNQQTGDSRQHRAD